jgi:uncharacterized membrane protein
MAYEPLPMPPQERQPSSSSSHADQIASGSLGGAVIGGSIFGVPGALIGAVVGIVVSSTMTHVATTRRIGTVKDKP